MLRLAVREGADELVGSLLWDAGTTGLVEIDGQVLAGFEDRPTAESVAERAAGWPVDVVAIEPSEWSGTDELTTVTIDGNDGSPVALAIMAGPTFGHGGHPTTALAIDLLTDAVRDRVAAGATPAVLDVGTGSGVLAVAAAALGASPVLGVDIDPEAVRIAAANAERNRVTLATALVEPAGSGDDGSTVEGTPAMAGVAGFDVVVVNVLARVQHELAAAVAGTLARGGSLITTGYLVEDGPAMIGLQRSAIEGAGRGPLRIGSERRDDGWLSHRFDLGSGHQADRC